MLANVLWNAFGVIGVLATILLVLYIVGDVRDDILSKRSGERRAFHEALALANAQSLVSAATTLAEVRMFYRPSRKGGKPRFSVPKFFWHRGDVVQKARALATLVTYDEQNPNGYGMGYVHLSEFLLRQVRRNPKMVLAIMCELAKRDNSQVQRAISIFYD